MKPKPEEEWAKYTVPQLVDEALWEKANANLANRGRGRGKQGRSIQALLRNRIFCPRCQKPMIVRRDGRQNRVYYHCSKYFRPWADNPCSYRRFISGTWDDIIWSDVCALLRDDAWIRKELSSQESQDRNVDKLVRLHEFKITQAKARISKVQEGFEGGVYTLDEAKQRLSNLQKVVTKGEQELLLLQESARLPALVAANHEAMVEELSALRNKNLDDASFEEKVELVSKLGIKVYPAEDLKTMKVQCHLNPTLTGKQPRTDVSPIPQGREQGELPVACGIVPYAPPLRAFVEEMRAVAIL